MISILNRAKWLLSGNILFAFSQWLMLIFFSHMSSPIQLGYYSYALAITAPIFLLSNLQLRPILIADFNTDRSFRFSQYFSLRLITMIIGALACIFFIDWNNKFSAIIFLLVIAIKASEAVSDIIYAHYNANKKTFFISKSLSIKSVLVILLSYFTLYISQNILYTLLVTLITYISILLFIDVRQNKDKLKNISFFDIELKRIFIIGLPLGLAVMFISLLTNIPRYFLEYYYNVELVGVYTIFYYFLVIGGIIINSICQYLSPFFSQYYRNNQFIKLRKAILQASTIAIFLGVTGLVISSFFHEYLVGIIYGKKYLEYSYVLPYIMLASIFSYLSVVSGYLLTSLGLLKIQLPIFTFLTLLTLLYSFVLIPKYGLVGAAYTTILSTSSQLLITSIIIFNKIRRKDLNV